MTDPLTPEARKEIQDAIAIVREDRFAGYVRKTLKGHKPADPPTPPVPPADPPPVPPKPVDPPPVPPKPVDPPAPPPKPVDPPANPPKRKSGYWGEIDD